MLRREPSPVKWCYLDEKGNKSEKQDHVCKKVNSELRALETSSDQTDSARKRRVCQEHENRPSTPSPDCGPAHVWFACDCYQGSRGTRAAGAPRSGPGPASLPPDAPGSTCCPQTRSRPSLMRNPPGFPVTGPWAHVNISPPISRM